MSAGMLGFTAVSTTPISSITPNAQLPGGASDSLGTHESAAATVVLARATYGDWLGVGAPPNPTLTYGTATTTGAGSGTHPISVAYPATAQSGDRAWLAFCSEGSGAAPSLTGWTKVVDAAMTSTGYATLYKKDALLNLTDLGTSVSVDQGANVQQVGVIFTTDGDADVVGSITNGGGVGQTTVPVSGLTPLHANDQLLAIAFTRAVSSNVIPSGSAPTQSFVEQLDSTTTSTGLNVGVWVGSKQLSGQANSAQSAMQYTSATSVVWVTVMLSVAPTFHVKDTTSRQLLRVVNETVTIGSTVSLASNVALPRAITGKGNNTTHSNSKNVLLTRIVNDSVVVSDAETHQLGKARSASDSVPVSAAVTTALAYSRAVSDNATVSEVLTRTLAIPRGPTDTASISDATTRTTALARSAVNQTGGVVQTKAGGTGSGTASSVTVTLDQTARSGRDVLIYAATSTAHTITTPSGFTLVRTTDNADGDVRVYLFRKTLGADENNFVLALSGADVLAWRAYEVDGLGAGDGTSVATGGVGTSGPFAVTHPNTTGSSDLTFLAVFTETVAGFHLDEVGWDTGFHGEDVAATTTRGSGLNVGIGTATKYETSTVSGVTVTATSQWRSDPGFSVGRAVSMGDSFAATVSQSNDGYAITDSASGSLNLASGGFARTATDSVVVSAAVSRTTAAARTAADSAVVSCAGARALALSRDTGYVGILNGGFDAGDIVELRSATPVSWITYLSGTSLGFNSSEGHTSPGSLAITYSGSSPDGAGAYLPLQTNKVHKVTPGATYQVSAYMKWTGAANFLRLYVQFYTALGGVAGTTPGQQLPTDGTWQRLDAGPIVAPANAETVIIIASLQFSPPGGTLYVDDVTSPWGPEDQAFLSESLSRAAQTFSRTTADSVPVSDSVVSYITRNRSTSDSIAFSDAVTRAAQVFVRTGADDATVAAAVAGTTTTARTVADSAVVSESASRSALLPRAVTDLVALSDAATRSAQLFLRAIADSPSISEDVARVVVFERTLTSDVVLVDDVASLFTPHPVDIEALDGDVELVTGRDGLVLLSATAGNTLVSQLNGVVLVTPTDGGSLVSPLDGADVVAEDMTT